MGRSVAPVNRRQTQEDEKKETATKESASTAIASAAASTTTATAAVQPTTVTVAQESSPLLTPLASLHYQQQQQQQQQPTQSSTVVTSSSDDGGISSTDEENYYYYPSSWREARDEEEDSLSLGYSDDSASLSDVYFLPGDDLARPGMAAIAEQSFDDRLMMYSPTSSIGGTVSAPPIYGSISSSSINSSSGPILGKSISANFGFGVPIQEDLEESAAWFSTRGSEQRLLHKNTGNGLSTISNAMTGLTPKERLRRQRKQKRYLQRMQRRLKEQAARERAVSRVRGQPQQVTQWQDSIWAFLFWVHFLVLLLCALRFGFGVLLFQGSGEWQKYFTTSTGQYFWEDQEHRMMLEATTAFDTNSSSSSSSSVTVASTMSSNTSLSDILFHTPDTTLANDDAASDSVNSNADFTSFTIDYKNVLALTFFTGLYGCVLTYLSFGFMLIIARSLIQIMLIFSILVALGWGLIGLSLDPYGLIADMGFGAFLLTLGYTMFSWNRIPFAATNLYTALCAMRCTADITILGLMSLVVAFGWCLLWCTAFVGVVNSFNNTDCNENDECAAHVSRSHLPVYLLFIFSFHWTTMVIKNVVRVTVASAVGTWWFRPSEVGPFCTAAVIRPLIRSMTKSFGSICLGSLIVQPAQICLNVSSGCCCLLGTSDSNCLHPRPDADEERQPMVHPGGKDSTDSLKGDSSSLPPSQTSSTKDKPGNDDQSEADSAMESVGLCRRCCRCISPCHRFIRASNRWSYTYIGMYGYSFAEAGERALQLFETRQWVEVVEDSLIQNVLLMASVVIGGSSGVFAVVVEETDGYDFTSFHQPIISAFVIGSVLGYVLSNILLLGVVGSAVNTILVCFAAGPFEFDKNHPRLSREMREVWSQQVWEPPV